MYHSVFEKALHAIMGRVHEMDFLSLHAVEETIFLVSIASDKMKVELFFLVKAYESDEKSISLKKKLSNDALLFTVPFYKQRESPRQSAAFRHEVDHLDLPALAKPPTSTPKFKAAAESA